MKKIAELRQFRTSAVCQMCLRDCGWSSCNARARSVWRLQAASSDYSRQMLQLAATTAS